MRMHLSGFSFHLSGMVLSATNYGWLHLSALTDVHMYSFRIVSGTSESVARIHAKLLLSHHFAMPEPLAMFPAIDHGCAGKQG